MKNLVYIFLFFTNLLLAQEKPIEISYEQTENGYVFYAKNRDIVPYIIKLNFKKIENLQSSRKLSDLVFTIPANTDQLDILNLDRKENSSSSFDFNFMYTIGDLASQPNQNFTYWLPYQHGKKVRVGQGNNGSGTHQGINAIDFNLEIGDSIYAARGGIVFDVKQDSNLGGNDPKFEPYGNYIKIYHEDGTVGTYVHLVNHGSLVNKGDKISRGQLIGISGNTGWSSGPHLHFSVSVHNDFQANTMPIKFLNYKGESFIPQESKSYYAFHQGKPAFELANKEAFEEARFEEEMLPATLKNKLEFESQEYDDYILIYVHNGFKTAMNGVLNFELNNLDSTKKIPYKFSVPAETKSYLLALYPKDGTKDFGYKLSAEFK